MNASTEKKRLSGFVNVDNRAETSLNGSISTNSDSIDVKDASVFPSPPFLASLEEGNKREIVSVNEKSGNTLKSVFRGQEDTTAQSFSDGTAIANRWTKGTYDPLVTEINSLENEINSLNTSSDIFVSNLNNQQGGAENGVAVNIFKNVEQNDSPFTKNSDSKITVNEAGRYRISYTTNFKQIGGGGRQIMKSFVRVNSNNLTPETECRCYIRNDRTGDQNGVGNTHILDLSKNDSLEVFSNEEKGGRETDVLNANVTIEKVD